MPYCTVDDLVKVFTTKIILEREIKLKEFNFKLLHGILPCNYNLKNWKIKDNNDCDVCGQVQTIEHLLYECDYVKPLWGLVEQICDVDINFKKILGLDRCCEHNNLLTVVCFLIYKEWLLLSLEKKKRNENIQLSFYKEELSVRLAIYEKCTRFDYTLKEFMNEIIINM